MTGDPITQARETVSGMTPGPWCFHPPWSGFYAECQANAAGIILATNLLRTLTSEGAEDGCAQAVATEMRGAHKGGTTEQDYRAARAVISHLLAQAIGERP